jgi:beta-carotene hydroxylase
VTKPGLPRAWCTPSPGGTALFIGAALAMTAGPAVLAWQVYQSAQPGAVKCALLVVTSLVSGQGLHLLAWVGHEGFHFNLAKNRHLSALLGIFFTAPIALFFTVGENSIHWRHHRFTNRQGDPQIPLYAPLDTFWRRLLLARTHTEWLYIRNTLRMAFGSLAVRASFSPDVMRRYAQLNVAVSLVWLLVYVGLAVAVPEILLVWLVPAHAAAFLVSSLRPYAEHAGTDAQEFRVARTRSSPWVSAFYFFNNYHLEHHLYPNVPCYRLPRVHRLLKEQGFYARSGAHVVNTVRGALAVAGSAAPYPQEAAESGDFDSGDEAWTQNYVNSTGTRA